MLPIVPTSRGINLGVNLSRAAVQNALNESFSTDVQLKFQTAPELVAGIELACNGQKVSWNIAGYLASLEQSVDEAQKAQGTRAG